MKGNIKFIFRNAIILLMTVFLCLPCSVKREAKQALNIPVASLEHSDKPNKTIACQTFTQTVKQDVSAFCKKKDMQNHDDSWFSSFNETVTLQYNTFSFSEDEFPSSVPIYILHEQYLI